MRSVFTGIVVSIVLSMSLNAGEKWNPVYVKWAPDMVEYQKSNSDDPVFNNEPDESARKELGDKLMGFSSENIVPEIDMEFVPVLPGGFKMGSYQSFHIAPIPDETPLHTVEITKGFMIGKYEVTQAQYKQVMGNNPSLYNGSERPVERVTWNRAVSFCEKLTKQERIAGRLPDGYEYRLPTEAEWEYAARGGRNNDRFVYSGSDDADEVAWHGGNSDGHTHKVGQKKSNKLGIHDMSGNVFEWCIDAYDPNYYFKSPKKDPVNFDGDYCVSRGGSYGLTADKHCRPAYRLSSVMRIERHDMGFRVVLAPSISE